MGKLARVVGTYRGTYSSSNTYNTLDVVRHNRKIWQCLKDNTKGIEPSDNANQWGFFVMDGDGGDMYTSTFATNNKASGGYVDKSIVSDGVVENFKVGNTQITASATEINYLDGVTSNIQAQINGKADVTGSLEFKNDNGVAKYSLNGGTSWSNFRNPTGNAEVGNVLVGKTFANASGDSLTGTMPNNGAFVGTITEKDGTVTIPAGYHNGSGYVSATYDSNISYCFKIGSLGAVASGTIDVSVACADILADYGIEIDPTTLTTDNFIVSTKSNTSGAYTPISNSSYIGGLSVGSRVKTQFYGHSVSYSNNILTVNNSKTFADAYVTVSDGGSVGHCNSGWIYASSDVYLVMIPS